jgi:hypothetical protein
MILTINYQTGTALGSMRHALPAARDLALSESRHSLNCCGMAMNRSIRPQLGHIPAITGTSGHSSLPAPTARKFREICASMTSTWHSGHLLVKAGYLLGGFYHGMAFSTLWKGHYAIANTMTLCDRILKRRRPARAIEKYAGDACGKAPRISMNPSPAASGVCQASSRRKAGHCFPRACEQSLMLPNPIMRTAPSYVTRGSL